MKSSVQMSVLILHQSVALVLIMISARAEHVNSLKTLKDLVYIYIRWFWLETFKLIHSPFMLVLRCGAIPLLQGDSGVTLLGVTIELHLF